MKRIAGIAFLALAGCLPAKSPEPAAPATLSGKVNYICAGGAPLVVDYNPGSDPPEITLNIDGHETLLLEPGTGATQRYSWPSDGSYHIWELSGATGTLSYRDGEAGTTTPVLTACRAQ